jgi:two-component system cell cycle sensor histidine kinase/response regulator CckA
MGLVTNGTTEPRKRVLLVDDDDLVRSVIADTLRQEGYTVIEAPSGQVALSLVTAMPPVDLVVSDVVMPGMPGPSLVARLRAQRPDLKVLFITGHPGEHDLRGERVLQKPFTGAALSEASLAALGIGK